MRSPIPWSSSFTMALDAALDIGKGVWKAGVFIYESLSGSDCKKLEQVVNSLLPTVTEMCESSPGSLPNSSVENFPKFLDKIAEGNQLVEEYKKCLNPFRKTKINERVQKLEKSITQFIQKDLQVVMASAQVYLSTQLETVCGLQVSISSQLETLSEGMETVRVRVEAMETGMQTLGKTVSEGMETVCVRVESVEQGVNNLISKIEEQQIKRPRQDENICRPPDTPSGFQGFDEHIEKVKKLVLADEVNVVEITAMGGAGKSTLAAAVCNDDEIRGHFKDRVIYIVVSKSAHLLSILKTLWRNIVGEEAPDFTGVEHAHDQLQLQINLKKDEPILVVLDDIWSNFEGKLLFEGKQYKTLVTTRAKRATPKGPRTHNYKLPSLQPQYALSLFCHYAFGKPSIPIGRDKELIEKVQQQCKGLPLALKVIGRSLYGETDSVWERAEKSLSTGEPFRDDHKGSLLHKLKTSIDVLDDNERECFLDLGAFPQRKTIPAKELLDIWVYVRRMKWGQAEMLLWKFEDHHLLDLKKNPGTAENTDDCMDGYSFSQHGVMRDLALYLANQDNKTQCRRLFMPKMENDFPQDWETDTVLSSKAQVVSIHTGTMQDTDWPKMEFPEVEALVLYFTASEYCIPTFLRTMKNLKVLIIHNNDNAKRAKLSGVAGFHELSQLKTLHLEKVTVPEEWKVLKSLEKINMILCEGLGRDKMFDFPQLLEFNVDYCIDLEELPAGLCSSISLKMLSVTHCHRLVKLPDELDKLGSLKEIRLCESLGLETLPSSICSLKKLRLVDISSCIHLKLSWGDRCKLKETLQTLAKRTSLKRVICDEKNEWLFKPSSRTDLKVQAVKEKEANLDWLDWEGKKIEF